MFIWTSRRRSPSTAVRDVFADGEHFGVEDRSARRRFQLHLDGVADLARDVRADAVDILKSDGVSSGCLRQQHVPRVRSFRGLLLLHPFSRSGLRAARTGFPYRSGRKKFQQIKTILWQSRDRGFCVKRRWSPQQVWVTSFATSSSSSRDLPDHRRCEGCSWHS